MCILELFDLARPIQKHVSQCSKVLVGYDGVNSIIGYWLDLEKPKSVRQVEMRNRRVSQCSKIVLHIFGKTV
jgi:hypothetical protein